jgi:hypothetical protein
MKKLLISTLVLSLAGWSSATAQCEDGSRLWLRLDTTNAVKAVTAARTKLDEFSADPKVQEVSRKTAETFKNAADTIGEAVKPVVQNVDAFMNKPEVQEKLADLRTAAAEVTDKAVDTVKDLLNIDDEDTSRSEEDTEDKNDTE